MPALPVPESMFDDFDFEIVLSFAGIEAAELSSFDLEIPLIPHGFGFFIESVGGCPRLDKGQLFPTGMQGL